MFIFHFISSSPPPPPHPPSPYHFPSFPLFPSSQGHALCGLAGLVSLAPLELSKRSGLKNQVPLLNLLGVEQERQNSDSQGQVYECVCVCRGVNRKRQMKRGSELQGCAFLWLSGSGVKKKSVAGCSVYYPQAIWVGKRSGCGGIRLCVCVRMYTPLCVRVR